MKPIYEMNCIQIEITNHCNLKCENCSRLVGKHNNTYYMSLEKVEEALQSLEGFKGIVGLMGGEPTIHPRFNQICELLQKYVPKKRRGLWTNGLNWNENNLIYDEVIRETFLIKNIVYNAHDYEKEQHQPILIPSGEIIADYGLWKELIYNCWVQERWSACINNKGAYFCEVAGALDLFWDDIMFTMPIDKEYKVEPGWWNKDVKDFEDQIKAYCTRCSMAIPLGDIKADKRYYGYSLPYTRKDYEKYKVDWKPWEFRDFWQHEPGKRIYHEKNNKG